MEDGRGGAAAAAAGRAWLFCEGCGGLLDFLAEEGVARCGICRRTRPQADFQDVQLVSRMTHEDMRKQFGTKLKIASSQAVDTQQSIKRATVRETCPQCGHKEMEFFTMQLRSVDEGQTVFYECPQCEWRRGAAGLLVLGGLACWRAGCSPGARLTGGRTRSLQVQRQHVSGGAGA